MLAERHDRLARNLDPALLGQNLSSLPAVVPNVWQGQVDCLVGPFSGRAVAERFADRVVDFGQFDAYAQRILPRRDGWFVEIRPDPPGA